MSKTSSLNLLRKTKKKESFFLDDESDHEDDQIQEEDEFDLDTDAQPVYELIISLQRKIDSSTLPASILTAKRGEATDHRFQPPTGKEGPEEH